MKSIACLGLMAALTPLLALADTAQGVGTGGAIPAGAFVTSGVVTSDIVLANSGFVASGNAITVTLLGLQHDFAGELRITLSYVDSTGNTVQSVDLLNGIGVSGTNSYGTSADFGNNQGSGDNYIFNSDYAGNIWSAAACSDPPACTTPYGDADSIPGVSTDKINNGQYFSSTTGGAKTNLSYAFSGIKVSGGTWRLTITDSAQPNTGSFVGWQLAVTTVASQQTGSVTAVAGTPQSATVSTAFASALQAKVVDASSNPVGGASVTFAAPVSGASAIFGGAASVSAVTNSSGIAVSPVPVANGIAGAYGVIASVSGLPPVSFSLTNLQVVTASPVATLSTNSLTFAAQTQGATSAAQTSTLSNTGNAALIISGITLGGTNAGDFATSNNCGTSLAAGGSCLISVTFTPSNTGTRTATLSVADNATGSPQTVTLSGTGSAVTTTTATATYLSADSSTQGTWTGKYGADGQIIAADITNTPAYAAVSFSGAAIYTWTNSTNDPRALQIASGSSTRISSTYYNYNPFTVDVNLTDGNTHKISLYLCDWDARNRVETVTILDAASQAVLSTQTFASFVNGVYESWNVKGHVQIQVKYTGGENGLLNAIFFDSTGTVVTTGATATYSGADSTTQGTWTGKYGGDGQIIPNAVTNTPAYAAVSVSGIPIYTWTSSTNDPRALQTASGSSTRISSTFYSYSPFTVDVNLTDGNTHKISLYLCDWDARGRVESVTILDAASQAVLSTQTFSSFTNGVYESWSVKGHVQIQVKYTGGENGLLNAIFFDPTGTTGTTGATASYSGADSTTLGTWTGKYGADGQIIPADVTNTPAYANVTFSGAAIYTWTTSTSDARALQMASGSTSRISSAYYSYNPFTVDVNLSDGNTHKVSLYLCDWDRSNRAETVTIVDASSQAVLSTQSFASFTGGVYEIWNIKGHVQIQVKTTSGSNALVNAVFFN